MPNQEQENSSDSSRPSDQNVDGIEHSSNPLPFILPLFVFLLIASFYPSFADSFAESESDGNLEVTSKTWTYIVMIGMQVLIATGLLIYFRKTYLEHFPLRFSPLSIVVGAVGVVLWIVVCDFQLEPKFWTLLGFGTSRPSFNPFTIGDRNVLVSFLVIRMTLLALIVPIIEELFLRGWLVRWVEDPAWENLSLSSLSLKALLSASVYGVVAHPGEAIAAFLWFGLVTWLMQRTGNLWDCVVAHAVTNLLLGIYILKFEQWHFW
jgi:CAAX prenyl protease-like protein